MQISISVQLLIKKSRARQFWQGRINVETNSDTVAVNKFFQGLKAKKDDKAKWKTADIHKSCHKDQSYVKLGHKNTPTTNICEDAF